MSSSVLLTSIANTITKIEILHMVSVILHSLAVCVPLKDLVK